MAAPWLVVLALAPVLVIIPFLFRLDGRTHGDWLQFLGRFHPLLVHIPIGILALLPLLEIAGTSRPAFRDAAGFTLQVAVAACVITLALGISLADGSGVTGTTVTRHMWSGIVLLIALLVCPAIRPAWAAGQMQRLYPAVLAGTFLILIWTAHLGGSLTHGNDYLARYMPGPLRRFIASGSVGSDAAYAGSVYMRRIPPIFDAKCVACYGAGKEQAGLRLDLYELFMKGGKDGAVIAPRNPDGSLLLQRVTLSPRDQHFMPAEGRAPLTPSKSAQCVPGLLRVPPPQPPALRELR
jgi:uncharacterized membrane protein